MASVHGPDQRVCYMPLSAIDNNHGYPPHDCQVVVDIEAAVSQGETAASPSAAR
jgi:hypothetical protein